MVNSPRFLSNSGFSLEDLILGACAEDPPEIPAVPMVLRFSVAHAPAPDPLFSHIRSADSIPADFLDKNEEITAGMGVSATMPDLMRETSIPSVSPVTPVSPIFPISPISEVPASMDSVSGFPISPVSPFGKSEVSWIPAGNSSDLDLSAEFPRGTPLSKEIVSRGESVEWNRIPAGDGNVFQVPESENQGNVERTARLPFQGGFTLPKGFPFSGGFNVPGSFSFAKPGEATKNETANQVAVNQSELNQSELNSKLNQSSMDLTLNQSSLNQSSLNQS